MGEFKAVGLLFVRLFEVVNKLFVRCSGSMFVGGKGLLLYGLHDNFSNHNRNG